MKTSVAAAMVSAGRSKARAAPSPISPTGKRPSSVRRRDSADSTSGAAIVSPVASSTPVTAPPASVICATVAPVRISAPDFCAASDSAAAGRPRRPAASRPPALEADHLLRRRPEQRQRRAGFRRRHAAIGRGEGERGAQRVGFEGCGEQRRGAEDAQAAKKARWRGLSVVSTSAIARPSHQQGAQRAGEREDLAAKAGMGEPSPATVRRGSWRWRGGRGR